MTRCPADRQACQLRPCWPPWGLGWAPSPGGSSRGGSKTLSRLPGQGSHFLVHVSSREGCALVEMPEFSGSPGLRDPGQQMTKARPRCLPEPAGLLSAAGGPSCPPTLFLNPPLSSDREAVISCCFSVETEAQRVSCLSHTARGRGRAGGQACQAGSQAPVLKLLAQSQARGAVRGEDGHPDGQVSSVLSGALEGSGVTFMSIPEKLCLSNICF